MLAGNIFLYASRSLFPPVLVSEVSRQAPEHRSSPICASIEDRAYCGVKLHLAACRSWVGRWDDGRLGALLLLRCCVLFVVAVVVAAVVLFLLVSIYVCLRVLVCSVIVEARRSVTRAGCRPPAPTLLCYY